MNFNERIKLIRKHLGLNQKEFGDILGVSQRAVSNWESGRNEPSIEVLNSISTKWAVNPTWLLTGKGEMFLKDTPQIAGIVGSEIQNAAITGHNGVAVIGNNNVAGNNNTVTTTSNLSDEDKMIQELITAFKKLPKRLQRGYYFKILGEAELYSEDEDNDGN